MRNNHINHGQKTALSWVVCLSILMLVSIGSVLANDDDDFNNLEMVTASDIEVNAINSAKIEDGSITVSDLHSALNNVLLRTDGDGSSLSGVAKPDGSVPFTDLQLSSPGFGDGKIMVSDASGHCHWQDANDAIPAATGNCPSGFLDAGEYCIDEDERPRETFSDALSTCRSAGGHICFFPEFAAACQDLNLLNATNNFEWTGNMLGLYVTRVGNGSCLGTSFGNAGYFYIGGSSGSRATLNFRCCIGK